MLKRICWITSVAFVMTAFGTTAPAQSNLTAKSNVIEKPLAGAAVESDRTRDGLVGPVRRVRTEIAGLSNEGGRLVEGKHAVLEIVAYDPKGAKIENRYFPMPGANLTGKEVYKYDDKGNISEMTLVNEDGTLISKEVYKYEFDFVGNWNKMTTSVAVIEGSRMLFEPTEVTYRSIMYYLDENIMKMAQSATSSSPSSAPANASNGSLDAKASPNMAQPSMTNASRKTSPSLPESKVTSDQREGLSVEAPSAKPNAGAPISSIQLETGPPPPPFPKSDLKPVSGGLLNGRAISLPTPTYPEGARRSRIAGMVTVEVVVDETGKVISAVATSGPSPLREVAIQAALRARFSPTKLSGLPVKVSGSINYKFALAQ